MICALCKGAQNQVCLQNNNLEWWQCQACGGAGVRFQFAPNIRMNEPQSKLSRKYGKRIPKHEQGHN